jgi:hypothetical protein
MLLSMECVCRKLDSAILVMKSAEDRQQPLRSVLFLVWAALGVAPLPTAALGVAATITGDSCGVVLELSNRFIGALAGARFFFGFPSPAFGH